MLAPAGGSRAGTEQRSSRFDSTSTTLVQSATTLINTHTIRSHDNDLTAMILPSRPERGFGAGNKHLPPPTLEPHVPAGSDDPPTDAVLPPAPSQAVLQRWLTLTHPGRRQAETEQRSSRFDSTSTALVQSATTLIKAHTIRSHHSELSTTVLPCRPERVLPAVNDHAHHPILEARRGTHAAALPQLHPDPPPASPNDHAPVVTLLFPARSIHHWRMLPASGLQQPAARDLAFWPRAVANLPPRESASVLQPKPRSRQQRARGSVASRSDPTTSPRARSWSAPVIADTTPATTRPSGPEPQQHASGAIPIGSRLIAGIIGAARATQQPWPPLAGPTTGLGSRAFFQVAATPPGTSLHWRQPALDQLAHRPAGSDRHDRRTLADPIAAVATAAARHRFLRSGSDHLLPACIRGFDRPTAAPEVLLSVTRIGSAPVIHQQTPPFVLIRSMASAGRHRTVSSATPGPITTAASPPPEPASLAVGPLGVESADPPRRSARDRRVDPAQAARPAAYAFAISAEPPPGLRTAHRSPAPLRLLRILHRAASTTREHAATFAEQPAATGPRARSNAGIANPLPTLAHTSRSTASFLFHISQAATSSSPIITLPQLAARRPAIPAAPNAAEPTPAAIPASARSAGILRLIAAGPSAMPRSPRSADPVRPASPAARSTIILRSPQLGRPAIPAAPRAADPPRPARPGFHRSRSIRHPAAERAPSASASNAIPTTLAPEAGPLPVIRPGSAPLTAPACRYRSSGSLGSIRLHATSDPTTARTLIRSNRNTVTQATTRSTSRILVAPVVHGAQASPPSAPGPARPLPLASSQRPLGGGLPAMAMTQPPLPPVPATIDRRRHGSRLPPLQHLKPAAPAAAPGPRAASTSPAGAGAERSESRPAGSAAQPPFVLERQIRRSVREVLRAELPRIAEDLDRWQRRQEWRSGARDR